MRFEPLAGGASNAMFVVERGSSRWVLRRPAAVALDRADDGMRREFRFLTALEGTPVPHPPPIARCDDPQVLGCTFYLMGHVDGTIPRPAPPPFDDPQGRTDLTFALVDALASLHDVDPVSRGDRRPRSTRWVPRATGHALARSTRFVRRARAARHRCGDAMARRQPARDLHAVDHARRLPHAERPRRCETNRLACWRSSTGRRQPSVTRSSTSPGSARCGRRAPTPSGRRGGQIVDRYRLARGGGAIGDLRYYEVLYNFRLAVLLEGIYQRSLRDPARPNHGMIGERVAFNVSRAIELADVGPSDRGDSG